MAMEPIRITLYDPATDEKKATFSRSFIPWKILKGSVRLMKSLDAEHPENISEEMLDEMAGLICEVFGNQFSVEDLNDGADVMEMMAVLQAVIQRANGLMANPTPPLT